MSAALQVQSPDIRFVLKVTAGPNKGDIFRISPPGLLIGRDSLTCKIALSDPRVSRQQCRIDFHPQGISIEDLSGKSTTLVNGTPLTKIHELNRGDEIQMGDTFFTFEVISDKAAGALRTAPEGGFKPPTPYSAPAPQYTGPKKSYKGYMIIGGVLAVGALVFFLLPNAAKTNSTTKVTTNEVLDEKIQKVIEQQQRLESARGELADDKSQGYYNHYTAEKNYIRGFRDYQNGKYSRAMEAFQTTLAVDPNHGNARRYFRLADKKRQEQVDQQMDLGLKYKDKNQYRLCVAAFAKVLQIINKPSDKKYILAKEQIKECRLCQGGQCSPENKKKEVNGTSQN